VPDQDFLAEEPVRVILQRPKAPDRFDATKEKYRFSVRDAEEVALVEQPIELAAGQSMEVTFATPPPSVYELTAHDTSGRMVASRSLEIRDIDREMLQTGRDMESLRQWASLSGGLARRSEDLDDVALLIEALRAAEPTPDPKRRLRQPLGVNGWVLCLIVGCLCVEWLVRRRQGLI
jgi:hypothetical protein